MLARDPIPKYEIPDYLDYLERSVSLLQPSSPVIPAARPISTFSPLLSTQRPLSAEIPSSAIGQMANRGQPIDDENINQAVHLVITSIPTPTRPLMPTRVPVAPVEHGRSRDGSLPLGAGQGSKKPAARMKSLFSRTHSPELRGYGDDISFDEFGMQLPSSLAHPPRSPHVGSSSSMARSQSLGSGLAKKSTSTVLLSSMLKFADKLGGVESDRGPGQI